MTRIKRTGSARNNPYSVDGGSSSGSRSNVISIITFVVFTVGCIIYHYGFAGPENSSDYINNRKLTQLRRGATADSGEKVDPLNIDLVAPPGDKLKLAEDIFKTADGDEDEDLDISIANHDVQKQYVFDDHLMFHQYYAAKSGSVVEEMLMFHAYVYAMNATYGGCCGDPSLKMTSHETLLAALGLDGVLQFKCPGQYDNGDENMEVRRSVIPRTKFHTDDTRVWTPEYVDYLRSLIRYTKKRYPDEYTITVHMQRGDSTPCRAKHEGFYRYLPNSHYQALIDKYYRTGARVIIYTSSAKSFESLEEFRKRGYEVHADASMANSWKDFATSDVLIMSRSDYLMVPAMVAKGTVVYTPFWHHSLRRWKRVPKSIMQQTDEEIERLRTEQC